MSDKILVVDDDPGIQMTLSEALKKRGCDVEIVSSAEAALEKISTRPFDLILLDVKLGGMSGIEAIPHIQKIKPDAQIIVITAYGSREVGRQAIQQGAYDYFTKPFSLQEMDIVIKRALEKKHLQDEINELRKTVNRGYAGRRIVGESDVIKEVMRLVERIAQLDVTVLITGESGTGKELIADALHNQSKRAKGPFIKLNCAAIPENLLESELFGYEKGAFTGAYTTKPGRFELAREGTIFLDEIGEMPLNMQAKLLRVVEEKRVQRLGGKETIAVNTRIIAATNQDLLSMTGEKKFRQDLYYRLNVGVIYLPPLRERKEDIPLLADHFIREINIRSGSDLSGLSKGAMELLLAYHWPGNIRELANVMEKAAIQSRGNIITPDAIQLASPGEHAPFLNGAPENHISLHETTAEVEKTLIINALSNSAGIQSHAARILGISPKNLWKKMQKHAIEPKKP